MNVLVSCFYNDPLSPLGEIVLRVINFPPSSEKLFPEDTITVQCSYNSTVDKLIQLISGTHDVQFEFELVFGGRILNETEIIPIECFESFELTDSVSMTFRSRITIVLLADQPLFPINSGVPPNNTANSKNEILENAEQMRRENELYEQQLIGQNDIVVESTNFNLLEQLEQIECGYCHDLLKHHGFDQEGTFSLLSEDDFVSLNINIPHRAKARILALSRLIQDNFENQKRLHAVSRAAVRSTASKQRVTNVINRIDSSPPETALAARIRKIKEKSQFATLEHLHPDRNSTMPESLPCCAVHYEKVLDRKMKLISINKIKFKTEVSSRLDWLEIKNRAIGSQCTAFAAFDDMFGVAWNIILKWGARSVQRIDAYRWVEKTAVLSLSELRDIEDMFPVRVHPTQNSLIGGYFYSKTKFVDVVVDYLEMVDPLYFIARE